MRSQEKCSPQPATRDGSICYLLPQGPPQFLFQDRLAAMRRFAHLLKLVGLVAAPLAILLNMVGVLPYGYQELLWLAGCVCLFGIGHLLETHAGAG